MKILTLTTLYPDSTRPRHGIFVETRLRQLISYSGIDARVVSPVPWFPSRKQIFGEYATYAKVPRTENLHGIEVIHPRYPLLPKLGMSLSPWLMAISLASKLKCMQQEGYDFDVIDAHYFYPDGVAAALLARKFGKPLVITARGSDLNLISRYHVPRKWIRWAAQQADHMITVSGELKQVLLNMGVHPTKVTVLRNGVDSELFRPVDRNKSRRELNMNGFVMLSVGNLVPAKRHDLVIEATARIPDSKLIVIGQGPELHRLNKLIARLGIESRVRILANMEQPVLRNYYGSADLLVLASAREGWPNVLLESMSCGTPVAATKVGAAADIVSAPDAGVLIEDGNVDSLVAAICRLRENYPDREATRLHAERFSWDETSAGQIRIFNKIIQEHVA